MEKGQDKGTILDHIDHLFDILECRALSNITIANKSRLKHLQTKKVKEALFELIKQFWLILDSIRAQTYKGAIFDKFGVSSHHIPRVTLLNLLVQVQVMIVEVV